MATRYCLISPSILKLEYNVDDNIDDKYLTSNIIKGEDFIIKNILTVEKYKELIDEIENNSVSDKNDELIKQYIRPCLAYYVLSEVVYSTAYKFKNNPDYQNNPASSERFNELVRVSKHYLNDSKQYEELLKEYMCNNSISKNIEYEFKCNLYLG